MAQQNIGVGANANDGTGDPLRTGGQKINANFTELYGLISTLPGFPARATNVIAGAVINQIGTASTPPTVQLYNPVGSGKLVQVFRVLVNVDTSMFVGVMPIQYQLAGSGGVGTSKKYEDTNLSATVPSALLKAASSDTSIPGTTGTGVIPTTTFPMGVQLAAGKSIEMENPNAETWILTEGWGLLLQGGTNGTTLHLNVSFVWKEV